MGDAARLKEGRSLAHTARVLYRGLSSIVQYFLNTGTSKHLKTDDTWKCPLIFSHTAGLGMKEKAASRFYAEGGCLEMHILDWHVCIKQGLLESSKCPR